MQRRTNLLWGIILLAAAAAIVAHAFGLIPEGLFDMMLRGWPALLVLGGLALLLRGRVPLGGLISLVITGALVGGLGITAYNTRASQQRQDYHQPIAEQIPAGVTLLRVHIQTLATEVEVQGSLNANGGVSGDFVGSTQSQVQVNYAPQDDGSATLTISEQQAERFPLLAAIGTGKLTLELPPGVPLDVDFSGAQGAVTLNMDGLSLERLNVNLLKGDATITLPEYKPQFSQPTDSLGTLAAQDGGVNLIVPQAVAAHLELSRGGSGIPPQFDATVYNYLVGDVLESRTIVNASIVVHYSVVAPRGLIRVQSAGQ
jgi:hypothetical protein